jgi:putative effector of murein hydrolase LrgA (UPF0299 family)
VAAVLLQHLSLLFVPVGVGVIVHLGALAPLGWKLGVVIVVSTWVGMTVTALVLRALLGGRSGNAEGDAHRPGVATTAPLPGKPTSPLGADRRHG